MERFTVFIPVVHDYCWDVEFKTFLLSSNSLESLKKDIKNIFLSDGDPWIGYIYDQSCDLTGNDNLRLLVDGLEDRIKEVEFKVFLREVFKKHNEVYLLKIEHSRSMPK